jgi:hypothetical protein
MYRVGGSRFCTTACGDGLRCADASARDAESGRAAWRSCERAWRRASWCPVDGAGMSMRTVARNNSKCTSKRRRAGEIFTQIQNDFLLQRNCCSLLSADGHDETDKRNCARAECETGSKSSADRSIALVALTAP